MGRDQIPDRSGPSSMEYRLRLVSMDGRVINIFLNATGPNWTFPPGTLRIVGDLTDNPLGLASKEKMTDCSGNGGRTRD